MTEESAQSESQCLEAIPNLCFFFLTYVLSILISIVSSEMFCSPSVFFARSQGNAPSQGAIASPASAHFGLNQNAPMPPHGGAGLVQTQTMLRGFGYNQPCAYPAMLLPLQYS